MSEHRKREANILYALANKNMSFKELQDATTLSRYKLQHSLTDLWFRKKVSRRWDGRRYIYQRAGLSV